MKGTNSLLGPLEGVGPENLSFLGPSLPMALEIDLPAIKIVKPHSL
jgi:hypothetical protein